MRLKKTPRGIWRADFKDSYGKECSIQESSMATEDHIWLGINDGTHHMGSCLARMHLSRSQAKQLIKHLTKFVETGKLK